MKEVKQLRISVWLGVVRIGVCLGAGLYFQHVCRGLLDIYAIDYFIREDVFHFYSRLFCVLWCFWHLGKALVDFAWDLNDLRKAKRSGG